MNAVLGQKHMAIVREEGQTNRHQIPLAPASREAGRMQDLALRFVTDSKPLADAD